MSMKPKGNLTPSRLRAMLCVAILLLCAGGTALSVFGYRYLTDYARQAQEAAVRANSSSEELSRLESTQSILDKNKDVIAKMKGLSANGADFQYQDQIISELDAYASAAGIGISNISFSEAGSSGEPAATVSIEVLLGMALASASTKAV